ncbi:GSCFA domain-containing protein [Zavarzinia sp.]|uniref:GSCFA domain-containing protein n=1 Tax=Zavarzinia sp. TaxID=2027920 RepID=UPI003BB7FE6D
MSDSATGDTTTADQGKVVDGRVEVRLGDTKLGLNYTFYRGEGARFLPMRAGMAAPEGLALQVLEGWMPAEPFIDQDTTIVAFGSCFAGHIGRYLSNLGFDVATRKDDKAYVSKLGDGIVNVFAIRQQFEWAWEGLSPSVELWHGYKAEEFGYDEEVRVRTRELFDAADVFIITLGLSEIWYDEPTGEVFWRAVPYEKFDPARHKFRVASSAETLDNLRRIHDLIRKHRPEAVIVFTVSPIPLSATFRPVSCVTANAASKALLRAAIDELYRERHPADPKLFYYPAYEVVTQCFDRPFGDDFRHPLFHVLDVNMKAFERYFCRTGLTDDDLAAVFGEAKRLDRALGLEDSGPLRHYIDAMLADWAARTKDPAKFDVEDRQARLARKAELRRERELQRASRIAGRQGASEREPS